ncbi:MAG TPA: hypothetical protein VHU84_16895, partial [Lacipirellulaceae bacterium]|nr:hypothetical protein [Lacipirellulaceae bacterium]
MFCSECGIEAAGKFCWSCGKPLKAQSGLAVVRDDDHTPAATRDWTELTDCQALLAVPEVRERIARHEARSKSKFSGEDFLACCDAVFTPLTGGVPLTLIAKIAQPISERLGLKTGKGRVERLVQRPGTVLVALLCSLAQNGQRVREFHPAANGCTILAAVPSDLWSLKGDLALTVHTEDSVT